MNVARFLVAGCDVWLNNPLRPQEASGTSGMKPPLHGGLNCSILDGWWPECFDGKNGWAIGDGSQLSNLRKQDRLDAQRIYQLLEKQIVPLYYHRDASAGLPRRWIAMMKHSMSTVGSTFNTHRMVGQYLREFYLPAHGAGGSATLVRTDKGVLNRRKALTRKFVSGEWGVELAGFDAASEADRKSALRRAKAWRH